MFRNHSRSRADGSSSEGLEARTTRFPAHQIREGARGRSKCEYVSRNVEGLNYILCVVLARRVAPAADLDVHLAIVLFTPPFLECEHAEDRGRFQVRRVAHRHYVIAVPETAIQEYFRTRPPARLPFYLQMERSAGVGPRIVRVIQIVRPPLITCDCANTPIIPAEVELSCWGELWRPGAFCNGYESYGTTR